MASISQKTMDIRHWLSPWPIVSRSRVEEGLKRLMDILLASAGLLALLPVLLVVGAMVKATSKGPVFYFSERIGRHYKPFKMVKFRTMCVNADAQRDQLRQEAQLEGQLFKLANDPRITPIGSFLRAFSLDELPQLLNVLKGDMSLVGPRPLPPDESKLFEPPYTQRFNVLPGITGLWQISGRSNLKFTELCQLEARYVHQWSFLMDLEILFKTVPVVLFRKGAY
jgi:lipopolysaccharide/colanic/teichoic acid biosynthesis glycosyltransferase